MQEVDIGTDYQSIEFHSPLILEYTAGLNLNLTSKSEKKSCAQITFLLVARIIQFTWFHAEQGAWRPGDLVFSFDSLFSSNRVNSCSTFVEIHRLLTATLYIASEGLFDADAARAPGGAS